MSLLMEQPYLTLNLIIYAIFFYNTYYFIQENQYCFLLRCVTFFIILAMVNYYVMEFRGEHSSFLTL